jgi:phenylpropionate dioxygenase-like ring-hydroxylating dioxygenase large terminal subunit
METHQPASREGTTTSWPRYDAATLGFRNYWYPVMLSRTLRRKPRSIRLCGEQIMLVRDRGRVHALHDRCPHRGVPLSAGRREFPGLITCAYHGWCYDLATGRLEVVLTDGPDSPICGKVNVRTYPVAERAGLIWVYVGDAPPPPPEADIPEELRRPDTVIEGLIEVRPGNWRYGVENAIDEGHAKYLHRRALWSMFSEFPAWTRGVRVHPSEDGEWMVRVREHSVYQDIYPRVGRWPTKHFWQSRYQGPSTSLRVRLPGVVRVGQPGGWLDYEIFVPVDANRHRALMLAVQFARGRAAVEFRARYWLYIRWLYHVLLNRGQDQWMIGLMNTPPERLYRPDVSITGWRRWCQEHARADGMVSSPTRPGGQDLGLAPTRSN